LVSHTGRRQRRSGKTTPFYSHRALLAADRIGGPSSQTPCIQKSLTDAYVPASQVINLAPPANGKSSIDTRDDWPCQAIRQPAVPVPYHSSTAKEPLRNDQRTTPTIDARARRCPDRGCVGGQHPPTLPSPASSKRKIGPIALACARVMRW